MSKSKKIEAVMRAACVTEEVARRYLEAEEWSVEDAICDILGERNRGLL